MPELHFIYKGLTVNPALGLGFVINDDVNPNYYQIDLSSVRPGMELQLTSHEGSMPNWHWTDRHLRDGKPMQVSAVDEQADTIYVRWDLVPDGFDFDDVDHLYNNLVGTGTLQVGMPVSNPVPTEQNAGAHEAKAEDQKTIPPSFLNKHGKYLAGAMLTAVVVFFILSW